MDGDGRLELAKPVDFCKMTPYERQRVQDAWRSEPRSIKIPSFDVPHQVRRTPFGMSIPALKAKCSPHTETLAIPRVQLPKIHYVTKAEKEAQRELEEQMTKEELRWLRKKYYPVAPTGVSKAALRATTTPRIEAMALAKLSTLCDTRKRYNPVLNQTQRNALNRNIKEQLEVFKSNYPPEADTIYVLTGGVMLHACCTGKQPEKRKRARCLCELSKNQRRNFRRRMKLMGQPKKPIVPDKGPDRGPKKRIKDFEPWLTMISQPRPNPMAEKTNTQNGNAPPPAQTKPKTPKAKKK